MIELKTEYPFNNDSGLIRHYAKDEDGNIYKILQNETNIVYDEAVDTYPCRYTYSVTNTQIGLEETEKLSSIEEYLMNILKKTED